MTSLLFSKLLQHVSSLQEAAHQHPVSLSYTLVSKYTVFFSYFMHQTPLTFLKSRAFVDFYMII